MPTLSRPVHRLQVTLISFAVAVASAVLLAGPGPALAANCVSGQLIKASTPAVYYCGANGQRYVFPNLNTYHTWYSSFSSVQTITDAALAAIPLGGNVTYRPGVRLVKIVSSPTVYAVDAGGVLHAIASENVAIQLYGAAWNKSIDDIPDAFFTNYQVSTPITAASQFSQAAIVTAAATINLDKGLAGASASSAPGVTLSLSPNVTVLSSGQTTTVTVTANDPSGIYSASVFMNGELLKTCSQSGLPTYATCSTTINGGDYADGSILSLYGQEVNGSLQRVISSTKAITTSGGGSVSAGSVTVSLSPAVTTLNAGQTTTVSVNAYDPAGLNSVAVFVNGALFQNCGQSGVVTSASCSAVIYGSSYPSGSNIAIYGQEVNKNGVPTISATTNLTVQVGSSANGNSVTLTFSPNATTLAVGDTMNVQIAAYAPLGVRSMSLYINGIRVQGCDASGAAAHANCQAVISGANYLSGTTLSVYGQASDTDSNSVISPTSTITITAGTSVSSNVSLSFSPYATALPVGQTTTVTVSATDPAGLSSLALYVNNVLANTCNVTTAANTTGNCSVVLNGANYASGSTLTIYGRATNRNAVTSTSPTSTLIISSAAVGNGSVSLFVSPAVTSLTGTQTATLTVNAYDPAGLSAVNIFLNGANVHSCSQSGIWPTGASCSYTIGASSYSSGASLSVYGQGVNTSGTPTNSTTSVIHIN